MDDQRVAGAQSQSQLEVLDGQRKTPAVYVLHPDVRERQVAPVRWQEGKVLGFASVRSPTLARACGEPLHE